jgi:hypothetical protein
VAQRPHKTAPPPPHDSAVVLHGLRLQAHLHAMCGQELYEKAGVFPTAQRVRHARHPA